MKAEGIKSKYIHNDFRLDGSFFLNDHAIHSRIIEENKEKCKPLSELAYVFNPPIFKRQFCQKTIRAVPYCQSSDVTNAHEESNIYINKAQAEKVGSIVKKNQILATGFGTIGNVRLVNELSQGFAYANNVCRIEPNDDQLYGYIYAFMASKFGKSQLNKNGSGSVVRYIEAPGIKKTLIPILPEAKQQEIHNLIIEAANLRVEANRLLEEAQCELKNRLEIEDAIYADLTSPIEKTVSNKFSISNTLLSSQTFRGRNYSLRKRRIFEIFETRNHSQLGDVLMSPPFYGSRYKRIESTSKNAVELLSQGDIFDLKPNGRKISLRSIKSYDQEIVSKGTILVPAQGTLGENEIFGRAKFVWGYLEEKLIAGHAMRFIPNEEEIDAGYLFCVLNSPLWFRVFRDTVYGTNLLGFIVPLLMNSPIPRFEKNIESRIGSNVKSAYEMLTNALDKELKAISLVEKEIESWQKL